MAGTGYTSSASSVANANNCSLYQGDIYLAVKITSIFSNLVSLLSSCIALFFTILFKRWHFFNQRLVLYLFLAIITGVIATILSRIQTEGICKFGGFASSTGSWMNLTAHICIMVTLLLKVFLVINLEKLDIPIILIIFASPFLFNWIPFINEAYGTAGPLCWIRDIRELNGTCEIFVFGQALQLVLWYVPLYVILSIMIFLYIIIFAKLCIHRTQWIKNSPDEDNHRKQALKYTISLLAYPSIYFLVNIIPLINRLHGLFRPMTPIPALWFLSGITFPQQGTGTAVMFLLSVRKKLTMASIKAALNEWRHKTQIKEYELGEDETESSPATATYARF